MNRRTVGRLLASVIAAIAFGWAAWAAYISAMPEVWVYDGFWMMLGAAVTVAAVSPIVWHWPRERALITIAIVSTVGSMIPLAISAARHHVPLLARLRGSWVLAGADLVGPAIVVGFVSLWFALREWRPPDSPPKQR